MTKIEKTSTFSRRALLQAGGAFVVSVGMPIGLDTVLGIKLAAGRRAPDRRSPRTSCLPTSPSTRTVSVAAFFGKTDMAQGLYTAIGQIVAEEPRRPRSRASP